jgi:hypothetical protein
MQRELPIISTDDCSDGVCGLWRIELNFVCNELNLKERRKGHVLTHRALHHFVCKPFKITLIKLLET